MLRKLSEQGRWCHKRAAEASQGAQATADPARKVEFLEMEKRWLLLASSFEFTESLRDFTAEHSKRAQELDEYVRTNAREHDASRPLAACQLDARPGT